MINYIGDVSGEDADVLAGLAVGQTSILEFGSGASTQILAYYGGRVVSVETVPEHAEVVKARIDAMGLTNVRFVAYPHPGDDLFNVVFVDGRFDLRPEFAESAWSMLVNHGVMAVHDTRRPEDISWLSAFIAAHWLEIGSIDINVDESNITEIIKVPIVAYVDWNVAEGRTFEQQGIKE